MSQPISPRTPNTSSSSHSNSPPSPENNNTTARAQLFKEAISDLKKYAQADLFRRTQIDFRFLPTVIEAINHSTNEWFINHPYLLAKTISLVPPERASDEKIQRLFTRIKKLNFLPPQFELITNKFTLLCLQREEFDNAQKIISWAGVSKEDDANGQTMLHFACQYGALNVAKILVAGNSFKEKLDRFGETPIFSALRNKHYQLMNVLINDLEVNPNAISKRRYMGYENDKNVYIPMPLIHLACFPPDLESARIICSSKTFDKGVHTQGGKTALHYAAEYSSVDILKLLRSVCDLEALDDKGRTSLNIACENQKFANALALIEMGANVNPGINTTQTEKNPQAAPISPLHAALKLNLLPYIWHFPMTVKTAESIQTNTYQTHLMLITKLIEKGANTEVTEYSETIFQKACQYGNLLVVQYLYKKFPEMANQLTSPFNETALHLSLKDEEEIKEDIVKFLISTKKIPLDAQDYAGNTALHLAVFNNQPDLYRSLVQGGASLQINKKPTLENSAPCDYIKRTSSLNETNANYLSSLFPSITTFKQKINNKTASIREYLDYCIKNPKDLINEKREKAVSDKPEKILLFEIVFLLQELELGVALFKQMAFNEFDEEIGSLKNLYHHHNLNEFASQFVLRGSKSIDFNAPSPSPSLAGSKETTPLNRSVDE